MDTRIKIQYCINSHSSLLRLYHSQQPANDGEKNSRILELNSTDFGKTWTTPDIFKGADFPGAFPRNRIIEADDGGLLFPIYNANDQHSIIERSNIPRNHWDHIDIQGTHDMVRIFLEHTNIHTATLRKIEHRYNPQ